MKTLITGGTVITMDPDIGDLQHGDVLIDNGVIAAVAGRIDAPDAEVIDAAGQIVMPGFTDTHRHTWQTAFRGIGADWTFGEYLVAVHDTLKPHYHPEDVYLGNLLGRWEALHSGITTMLDWFHCGLTPEHTDAAITALHDVPGRSVFCYGAGFRTSDPIDAELRRVQSGFPGGGLVTMALGLRGPEMTSMDITAHDLALATELGLRTSVHIETGANGGRPIAELHAHGLLSDTTTFVHANAISDDQLRMLADAGSTVSISPDVELKMGIGWPMTGRMLAAGLRPTLSIDDTPSAAGDMFATMRTAYAVQRGLDGTLNSRDLLQFATINGAEACGLANQTGSLTPSKDADIVLLRADDLSMVPANNPAGTIVTSGHPGLVHTVLVAGQVVKRHGELVGVDLPALMARLRQSRDRIAAVTSIPLDGTWRPTTTWP